MFCIVCGYSMNPSLYSTVHGRGPSLRKDDCCDSTLAIYLIIYQCLHVNMSPHLINMLKNGMKWQVQAIEL